MNEMHTLYIKKLEKALSIEDQLVNTLPELSKQATSTELRAAIEEHLMETKVHKSRLEEILSKHASMREPKNAAAFAALLRESEAERSEILDPTVKDVHLIASARTVEHIEKSIYMTLIEWAKELNDDTGEELLKQTLKEEDAAEKKLAALATGGMFGSGMNSEAAE